MSPDPQHASPDADTSAPASATLTRRPRTKSELDKVLLERHVNRDLVHSAALLDEQNARAAKYRRMTDEADDYKKVRTEYRQWFPPSRLYGEGYKGNGNGTTDGPTTQILYLDKKSRLGDRKTPRLKIKRSLMAQQADAVEELVPIRLDVEWDKVKLRDTFTWNLSDRVVAPQLFAEQLVEDLGLKLPAANELLAGAQSQIRDQLTDFFPQVYIEEDALDPELPYLAYKNEEMRILIKLNITIGPHTLEDKFEWEINNPLNSPEEFARSMARELSLSGEFTTAIAHCIREQCQLFTRSLYIVGHPFDGRPLEDADLVAAFLPSPLPTVLRPQHQARDYVPILYELTETDLERGEVAYSREQRRQKRSVNRRGGPTLPDLKDRPKTVRTLIVSSVIPGAAETVEDSRLYKRVAGATGSRKNPGVREGDLSESDESEDSSPESPMINVNAGTTRTRNMRGAATAAQQRMANIGRSETPEAAAHHHETRTSARRFGGRDIREESLDTPATLIIKLKLGRESSIKFEKWKSAPRPSTAKSTSSQAPSASQQNPASSKLGTPVPRSMAPPQPTPNSRTRSLPPAAATTSARPQGHNGQVDAPPPPAPGQPPHEPPPPPSWLSNGLDALKLVYPKDRFVGIMRYSAVDAVTETPRAQPAAGQSTVGIKYMFLPRIRCLDCPGKLYTPGPGVQEVVNFETHLRNRQHQERVKSRLDGETSGDAGGGSGGGDGGASAQKG